MDSAIERIKSGLSIAAAWRHLGLRGSCGKECRSPFRDDKHASFSVYRQDGWERWWDHGSASGGDVVDLWARAKEITVKEATLDILASFPHLDSHAKAPNRPLEASKRLNGIRWPPDIRAPSETECRALGALRGLSPEAFFLAGRLGTLKVATVYGSPAWIITDLNNRCAEARRFDGQMYQINGKAVKSFCLPGSRKDLPLGLKTLSPHWDALNNILLVEGMPDYYAALQLALGSEINFRPIAILGAGLTTFSDGIQQYLIGKKILIICHNDPQGQAALPKWVKALYSMGAKSIVSSPLPFLHDDLNDFLQNPGADQPLDLLKGFINAGSGARLS
jgi:hypothetical protein